MIRNRWYPTNTTLSDGSVLTTSGETEPDPIVHDYEYYPELFQSGNWTTLMGASQALPLYPWMFQAPNGKVFYAGSGPKNKYLDPNYTAPSGEKGHWTELGDQGRSYNRVYGTAAMFWPGRILVAGGSDGQTVTNTTEVIDLTSTAATVSDPTVPNVTYYQPAIAPAAPLRHARWHVNSTLLPDGTVLVTGGSPILSSSDRTRGVLDAEIWTPTAGPNGPTGPGTWTTVAPMKEARMYHSTAVLLPDGRVLSAGGEENIHYDPFVPNQNNHCTAEIYSPPYLFDANGNLRVRPVISYAPALASYGQPFVFDSPDAASIDQVTWIRLSSVTHSFNMNQRFLRLPITGRSATSVTATAPGSANDCPPGHYLVFALRGGVPSEAKVVAIGNNPCGATLGLTASISLNDCSATAQVSASGTNLGSSYHWYIDGTYDQSYDGQTSISVGLNPCRPQATATVVVIPACGGAALTSSQSVSAGPFQQNGQFCLCNTQ